ncbi:vinorine synthase-like [Olea europaea subsp. europaea]|uniref:Vinorine synthase-like n=1 Tax=Olea europaea subsp. europaea TaxID=158383 RepID=A0A8S0UVP2_OLEEU|nr:vinorine synthase-like [Olea europaea subsp. europaea]
MVIGVIVSHAVAGGITLCSFLKAWAATAAGALTFIEAQCPNYIAQSLFPPNDKIPEESYLFSNFHPFLITGNCVLKRYVFDSSAISTLKAKSPGSRVQVMTAFIWKCFMAACAAANNFPSLMVHAVDLRSRAVPPFSENCFGNFLWIAAAAAESMNHTDHNQANLVTKVRESIRRIDGNFVKRIQGDEGMIGYIKNLEETNALIPGEANCLNFSSWCNFGVYDIDFGWGKPIWVANYVSTDSCNSPKLNDVMFLDTRDGKGMEVYVTIGEQYAAAFDKIEELQSLISINPSPLEFQHL